MKKLLVIPLVFAVLFGATACGKKISAGKIEIEEKGASVPEVSETAVSVEKEEETRAGENFEVTDKEVLEELASVLAKGGEGPKQRSDGSGRRIRGGYFRTYYSYTEDSGEERFGEIDISNAKVYCRDGHYYLVEKLSDGKIRVTEITYDSNGYAIRSGVYDDFELNEITGKK